MRKPYLERLQEGVLLFDGAMGTTLYNKGFYLKKAFEEANLTRPDMIREVHREYVRAGAQAIETNTYGANRIRLAGYGLQEKTAEINRAGAVLAREEAGEEIYVAGSVGPLESTREEGAKPLTREELQAAFREQMAALLDGGVDLILLESFRNIDELILGAETARELDSRIPVQAQFTLGSLSAEEYRRTARLTGHRLDVVPAVDAVGVNCTVGPADALEMVRAMGDFVKKPIAVMPNAGAPREVDGRQIYLASPEYFAEYAKRFLEAGASVIGGCCGTTDRHISEMAKAVLALDAGRRSRTRLEQMAREGEGQAKEPTPLADRSRLGRYLADGRWITTVELVSPAGTDLSRVLRKAADLYHHGIDFINIPDGPRASSRMSALVTALQIERQTKIETIPHICTRDRNLIALQSDLLSAQSIGLRNMLLVTGDPPKVGKFPDVTGVFDTEAVGLTGRVHRLIRGLDLAGQELPEPTDFVAGCGVNPTAPVLEKELDRAFEKAEAGARFFITQPVYEMEALADFLDRLKPAGLPVIMGVWPLAGSKNAVFLEREVPGVHSPPGIMERLERCKEDKEKGRREGVRIARGIIAALGEKAAGVQLSPPFGRLQTVYDVIAEREPY